MTEAEPDTTTPPGETLWRDPDFRKLWAGQTVSLFGSLISRTALPFTAVLFLKATPAQMAVLAALDLAPGLAAGLFAGVWADRVRRRPLLIAADLLRAAALCLIPLAAWTGDLRIGHLYGVAVLMGALNMLFDVAYGAYLPALVGPHRVSEGNAKLTATASAAEVGAFGLSGWLVQWFGAPVAVLLDAASFLVSTASLALIRRPEPPPGAAAPPLDHEEPGLPPGADIKAEVLEGLRAVARHPLLRALAVCEAIQSFSFRVFGTLFLLFVTRELRVAPGVQGMIFAVGGVTSLLRALLVGPITRRLGVGKTMALAALSAGVGAIAVGVAPAASVLTVILLVANQLITDPGYTVLEIHQKSVRQASTPDRLRGRVEASLRCLAVAAQLLGIATAGLIGETLGMRAAVLAGAVGACLAALPLLTPAVRRARL